MVMRRPPLDLPDPTGWTKDEIDVTRGNAKSRYGITDSQRIVAMYDGMLAQMRRCAEAAASFAWNRGFEYGGRPCEGQDRPGDAAAPDVAGATDKAMREVNGG